LRGTVKGTGGVYRLKMKRAAGPHPKPTARTSYHPSYIRIYETWRNYVLRKIKKQFCFCGEQSRGKGGKWIPNNQPLNFDEGIFSASEAYFFGVLKLTSAVEVGVFRKFYE
jgi:hypothetical protein